MCAEAPVSKNQSPELAGEDVEVAASWSAVISACWFHGDGAVALDGGQGDGAEGGSISWC